MHCRWILVLARTVLYTTTHPKTLQDINGYVPGFYQDIRWLLLVFQTAAFLEVGVLYLMGACLFMQECVLLQVVHSAVGLVRSAVTTTLLQVYSRLFVVWALMEGVVGVSDNVGLLIVCYAWAITEVIRYSYYFFSLLEAVPYPLVWCRYA